MDPDGTDEFRTCGHRIMAITLAFQANDAGSIPAARPDADIAQLVERTLGKGEVGGSNPPISTSLIIPHPYINQQINLLVNVV